MRDCDVRMAVLLVTRACADSCVSLQMPCGLSNNTIIDYARRMGLHVPCSTTVLVLRLKPLTVFPSVIAALMMRVVRVMRVC